MSSCGSGHLRTRSFKLEELLEQGNHSLPFDELVPCNIGNPQASDTCSLEVSLTMWLCMALRGSACSAGCWCATSDLPSPGGEIDSRATAICGSYEWLQVSSAPGVFSLWSGTLPDEQPGADGGPIFVVGLV